MSQKKQQDRTKKALNVCSRKKKRLSQEFKLKKTRSDVQTLQSMHTIVYENENEKPRHTLIVTKKKDDMIFHISISS
jgi:hypothetical protein